MKAFITSTESSEPLIMKISKEFWIREWKFSYVINDNLMSRKRKRNPSIHTYSSEYLLINVRGSEVMCGICLCLTLYNWQMIYLTAWHFKIKIDNSRKVTLHIWNVNVINKEQEVTMIFNKKLKINKLFFFNKDFYVQIHSHCETSKDHHSVWKICY